VQNQPSTSGSGGLGPSTGSKATATSTDRATERDQIAACKRAWLHRMAAARAAGVMDMALSPS